jgi:hypothetical protein
VEIWGNKEWEFKDRETITVKEGRLPSIQQFDPKIDVESLTSTEKNHPYISSVLKVNRVKFVDVLDKASGNRYPQLLEEFYIEDWDTAQYAIGDTILRLKESLDDISLKDYILEQDQIILIIARDLKKANFSRVERLKETAKQAKENGIDMILITTASKDDIVAFREEYGLNIPTVLNDATEIKAITRSNPTMMVIKNGVVEGKYAFRATPSWEWLTENILDIK